MTLSPKEQFKEYRDLVSKAVIAFQLIEDNLKLYIKFSFKLIRVRLDKEIPFRFDGSEYENAPLERLITIFSKLTDQTGLVERLNKIRKERNYCAHAAFVEYINKLDDQDSAHAEEARKIEEITKEAWDCLIALLGEVNKLDGRIKKGQG